MLYRTLGKTGEKVSAIGLGGYHVGHPPDPADAIQIVRSAIDRGITFMDNSWDYNAGESERRVMRSAATKLTRSGSMSWSWARTRRARSSPAAVCARFR